MSRRSLTTEEISRRERVILEAARRILLRRGLDGLTMDRLAAQLSFSKGTLYNHFASKEDVLLGLAAESERRCLALFKRAALFPGRARERYMAIGVAFQVNHRLQRDCVVCWQMARATGAMGRGSPARRLAWESAHLEVMAVPTGILRDAVAQGDLVLGEGVTPDLVNLGAWAVSEGLQGILSGQLPGAPAGASYEALLLSVVNRMLDGFGWRPLSTEHDYTPVLARAWSEIFAEEAKELEKMRD